jgi:hypothetical protein
MEGVFLACSGPFRTPPELDGGNYRVGREREMGDEPSLIVGLALIGFLLRTSFEHAAIAWGLWMDTKMVCENAIDDRVGELDAGQHVVRHGWAGLYIYIVTDQDTVLTARYETSEWRRLFNTWFPLTCSKL